MSRRLRIMQVITRLDRGGSADVVVALCGRLDRARFDLSLVTGPSAEPVEEPAALADRLGIRVAVCADLVREVSPRRDLRAAFALRACIESYRPDVVHTHTSKAGAVGRLAARLAGRVPVIHSTHGHVFYGYYGVLGSGLVMLAERTLAPLAERIAVLTDLERIEHLERGIGRAGQFVTVPSGIDLARFRPNPALRGRMSAELGLGDGFVIGWLGRFTGVKRPDLFIESCGIIAARRPDARFVLIGDGPLRAPAEAQAAGLGIAERCRFLGFRPDPEAVLNACDAYALSSSNEGLGLAAVEAMACGVPVVATRVGGLSELLDRGRAGLLVRPGDPAALADALLSLATDGGLRDRLIRAGFEQSQRYGIDVMVERFAALYEELAQP